MSTMQSNQGGMGAPAQELKKSTQVDTALCHVRDEIERLRNSRDRLLTRLSNVLRVGVPAATVPQPEKASIEEGIVPLANGIHDLAMQIHVVNTDLEEALSLLEI